MPILPPFGVVKLLLYYTLRVVSGRKSDLVVLRGVKVKIITKNKIKTKYGKTSFRQNRFSFFLVF